MLGVGGERGRTARTFATCEVHCAIREANSLTFLAGFGLGCEFPVADLAPVLRTVHRLDISSNPDLEGGTSANTLMALSATVAPNISALSRLLFSGIQISLQISLYPQGVLHVTPNLISVRISRTEATGTIPDCMIQTHLRELEMSSNALSGPTARTV